MASAVLDLDDQLLQRLASGEHVAVPVLLQESPASRVQQMPEGLGSQVGAAGLVSEAWINPSSNTATAACGGLLTRFSPDCLAGCSAPELAQQPAGAIQQQQTPCAAGTDAAECPAAWSSSGWC